MHYKNGNNNENCRIDNLDFDNKIMYTRIIKTAKVNKIAELIKVVILMNQKTVLNYFRPGETFGKNQFREAIHVLDPEYAESSVNWLLAKLKKENQIITVGRGKYERVPDTAKKKQYAYIHSEEYNDIERKIMEKYPLVDFQMWELIQFNEFVNHQISKNLIVVEVENMLDEAVFDMLHEEYPYVLYSPHMEYYYRHKGGDNTVVVLKLISEAPKPVEGHSSPLEKLLVDLFVNKFTGHLIERSEYPVIVEDAFRKYYLDESKMFRYARRRNVEARIKTFIRQETEIKLRTEG